MDITTEKISIDVGGAPMGGYLARPSGGGDRPAVIVWMEIFGVNAHIRDVTERVAREGYVAIAPDFFHRTLPGVELGYDEEGMAKGMTGLAPLDADEMIADQAAAIAYLRSLDGTTDKIGVMGFCIGGHMTYLTACEHDIAAAASFYGGGIAAPQGPGGKASTTSRTSAIKGKILCLFGGDDALIPPDQVETIRGALEAANTRHEVVVYEGADHGFHCDQRATFHQHARDDSWSRVKQLFAQELA